MNIVRNLPGNVRKWVGASNLVPSKLFAVRERIAQQYISGNGIEFGALHCPLAVPPGAKVKYADFESADKLRKSFPDVAAIRSPDVIADLESMRGIDDESQGFVIANHVFEHVEDPIRALSSTQRVLTPSGIAFIALPDKRFTFDKDREITPLAHLIKDHDQGPDWSIAGHYDEWCRCVDRLQGDAHAQKVSVMLQERSNIHFHVWDYPAMMEFFAYVVRRPASRLGIELSLLNGGEVIWILRKRTD